MVNDAMRGIGVDDADTHELIEVATDEDQLPDVRRAARESLQDKVTDYNLVELMGGWELHVQFGGVEVTRDLGGIGFLLKAYLDVVGPSRALYTTLATAVGDDFSSQLKRMAEKVADEGGPEVGEPRLGG